MVDRDGGPAFPIPWYQAPSRDSNTSGMTLQQYYVGQCLAGLMANPNVVVPNAIAGWALNNCDCEDVAEFCRAQVDAILKQPGELT